MRADVDADKMVKSWRFLSSFRQLQVFCGQCLIGRRRERRRHAVKFLRVLLKRSLVHGGKFFFNSRANGLNTFFMHQNFNARFIFIVTPAIAIIDAHNSFKIR